ncbi:MAG: hypothetical protein AVDCRST_MAG07-1953, partial [uncultured Frankineae bacterium]
WPTSETPARRTPLTSTSGPRGSRSASSPPPASSWASPSSCARSRWRSSVVCCSRRASCWASPAGSWTTPS